MHYAEVRSILSAQNGINVYRGCTHGCIYCDSRSRCYHMDHAFTDVEVKRGAAELLEAALRRKRRPCMVSTGSMCDPYQPVELTERLTRRCLKAIERCGCGAVVLTKSDRVLEDLDLLRSINAHTKCVVQMTLTTADDRLCRLIEPDVCPTSRRAETLRILRDEGIPTAVWLSPILPFINDTEENLRGVLELCFEAEVRGIICFGMGLTLREGNREYFYGKLDRLFPGMKERYITVFGDAYQCNSPRNDELMDIFERECRLRGVMCTPDEVFNYLGRFEDQLSDCQQSLF